MTVFPAVGNLGLNVVSTNLPSGAHAAFRVVQPAELVYDDPNDASVFGADRERAAADGPKLLPPLAHLAPLPSCSATTCPRRRRFRFVRSWAARPGCSHTGFRRKPTGTETTRVSSCGRSRAYVGVVQLTNVGVFAQWFPHSGIVRDQPSLRRLADRARAKVVVYESQLAAKQWPAPEPCATGTADANGAAAARRRGVLALRGDGHDGHRRARTVRRRARRQRLGLGPHVLLERRLR